VTAPTPPVPALPPRPPRTLLVHLGVDSAVAFLAMVVLFVIIFGASVVQVALVALVLGAVAAPFTQRAEARGLAARERAARTPLEAPVEQVIDIPLDPPEAPDPA
jgi:hypothetical protein